MTCKCHGKLPIEIKCPFNIRNKTVREGVKDCCFLTLKPDGEITINKSHKYYTQIVSHMSFTGSAQAVFVVWTPSDLFTEIVTFDEKHWEKVKTNLEVFFKVYICPVLLGFKPITFCAKCDNVLLENKEIDPSEKAELNSIQCDLCCAWSHYKCENLCVKDIVSENNDWVCSNCLLSLAT